MAGRFARPVLPAQWADRNCPPCASGLILITSWIARLTCLVTGIDLLRWHRISGTACAATYLAGECAPVGKRSANSPVRCWKSMNPVIDWHHLSDDLAQSLGLGLSFHGHPKVWRVVKQPNRGWQNCRRSRGGLLPRPWRPALSNCPRPHVCCWGQSQHGLPPPARNAPGNV